MLAVAGYYRLVAVLVNALRIEHEPYARGLLDALAPDRRCGRAGPHAHEAPARRPVTASRNQTSARQGEAAV
jgi:hypothetical protein